MITMQIEGFQVYVTETHRCACYLIETSKKRVLIDTSMQFERNTITKCIQKTGNKGIDAIFLTHSHTDHVANALYFSNMFNCEVYISKKGIHNMKNGHCNMPKGTNALSKGIYWAESRFPLYNFSQFHPCPQVRILNDEVVTYYLGDSAELLETPGHTDDSISILLKREIAIVGDLVVNAFGNLYPPFADDESALSTSWKALLDTRCNVFLPAHGRPIHRKKLISSYKKHFLYASKGHS